MRFLSAIIDSTQIALDVVIIFTDAIVESIIGRVGSAANVAPLRVDKQAVATVVVRTALLHRSSSIDRYRQTTCLLVLQVTGIVGVCFDTKSTSWRNSETGIVASEVSDFFVG